ncbi:ERF family protein [Arthrobacter sp. Alg241-R88]|uniref:ERF family protein n=1 Tax=Arthrobacter sp. Alg241-R88 TaxID=2305984 RepID=UPI0013D417BC|nr:ERF family protein [Arthrobacter sp. Alg241-R88]
MTDPEKHPNLQAALSAFQAEMPTVAKTKRANVGQYSYSYADLADVTEAAAPILSKHGLAFAGSSRHVEGGRYEVVGILSHESGNEREGALPISGGTPQQIGSAITYMRRYLFGVMTGLVTDGDDDGELASTQLEQKRERRRATAEKPMTAKTRGQLFALFGQKGIAEADQLAGVNHINGTDHTSRTEITEAEAVAAIAVLKTRPDAEVPA